MTHVVTERCVDCRYVDCARVCPVDCFYVTQDPAMLVINPDECIDCKACIPECPVEAICHEDDVPAHWKDYVELNREMAARCPQITEKKAPLRRSTPE